MKSLKVARKLSAQQIIAGVVLAGFIFAVVGFLFLGLFSYQGQQPPLQSTSSGLGENYKFGELTVKAQGLNEASAQKVTDLMRGAVKDEFLPKILEIRAQQNPDDQRVAYVGSWLKEGKFFFVLFAPKSAGSEELAYFRTWFLASGNEASAERAKELANEVFSPAYSRLADGISCRDAIEPEHKNNVVECFNMADAGDGSLAGVTVKAPYLLGGSKEMTIVYSCFIPATARAGYSADTCI